MSTKKIRKAKKVTEKCIKKNNPLIYPVCDVLIAKDESDDVDNGDNGVFCEGTSQTSIHRKCVSMCKTLYKNWVNLMMPNCMIAKQFHRIAELKILSRTLLVELTI